MNPVIPSFVNEIIIIEDTRNGGFVGLIPGMDGAVIIGNSEAEIKAKATKIAMRISTFRIKEITKEFSNNNNFKVTKQFLATC
jgi:hypothetical protein